MITQDAVQFSGAVFFRSGRASPACFMGRQVSPFPRVPSPRPWMRAEYLNHLFSGCTCWSSSGYDSTIGTLRVNALVNDFYWGAFFIRDISLFTCWSFYSYVSLTVTLEGTDVGVAFLNISARDLNASLCAYPGLTSGLSGAELCSK